MTDCRRMLCWLIAGAGLATLAQAETSPYYIGASQSFTHDSNLVRLPDGQAEPAGVSKADTVAATSLLAGLDQPIGRQRVFGNLTLRDNRLSHNDLYNNQSYSLASGADWETVERLSGTVRLNLNRSLASFNADNLGLLRVKNQQTTQQFDTTARIGTVTALTIEGTAGYRSLDYSAPEYRTQEFSQSYASLGLRYKPAAASTFGVALRQTQGKYPKARQLLDGSFQADRFDRRDLDLTGTLVPSAVSNFYARLSLSKTDYDIATQRNFSGVTGQWVWNWMPTGKLRFNTQLTREPGQDSYFLSPVTPDATVQSSRLTTALRSRADYAFSAKIAFYASAVYLHRSLVQTLSDQAAPDLQQVTGGDHTTTLALGGTWAPTRSLQFGCDLSNEKRRGQVPLSYDYGSTAIGCSAQFLFQ